MIARIQSFTDGVPAISDAYWSAGGGPAGAGEANRAGCQAAYDASVAAIEALYGEGQVLFKPTLTTQPYTYRTTPQGALSYFIGTECLQMIGTLEDQFPPGNDGTMFQEYGFGLRNYNNFTGFINPTVWDPEAFYYHLDGPYCDTSMAMGQVCFTSNGSETEGNVCVDKTWAFGRNADGIVEFTSHHSSAVVPFESSITICQGDGDEACS